MVTARMRKINDPPKICKRPSQVNDRTNSAGTFPTSAAGMSVSRMNLVAVLKSELG